MSFKFLLSSIVFCLVYALVYTSHAVVDTSQTTFYDKDGNELSSVGRNDDFFGQDANYIGVAANYTDNGDGTILDHNTELLWEKAHHETRLTYYDASTECESLGTGWRLPTIKELFSLTDFTGSQRSDPQRYYIDDVFDLELPGEEILEGENPDSTHTVEMMGQTWSSTIYAGDHWDNPNREAAFFFNFFDGHIKQGVTRNAELFYRCVHGDEYGVNSFAPRSGGTVVKDLNSGLLWEQTDSGTTMDWEDAMKYCEGLSLGGKNNWRLPNVKELQSIVDYTREEPAIDPIFTMTNDSAWFWSSTTHGDSPKRACYICFGKCVSKAGVDTHGAGAQRADPKYGDPADYSEGFGGDQDDEIRIYNYVRCVRGGAPRLNFGP